MGCNGEHLSRFMGLVDHVLVHMVPIVEVSDNPLDFMEFH
jgi:hypothetical protein